MKRFYQISCLILSCCLLLQCKKDHLAANPQKTVSQLVTNPVTADLQGIVKDENDQPAAGVKVTAGTKSSVTDASGYFHIAGAALDKKVSLLVVEKDGYFTAYRQFSATAGVNQQFVKLVRKSLAGTVSASSGGDITLADGAKISLPGGGVVIASSNAAYNGTISVYAIHNDLTAVDPQTTIANSSVTELDGKLAAQSSFGQLTVELESTAGENCS